jgi:hypothetical protein
MSTRSHVRVYRNNEELAAFYHHYDGYLEGVGKELVDIAKKETITSPEQFIADLDASYEKRHSLSKSDDQYIDYLYYVYFYDGGDIKITYSEHEFAEKDGKRDFVRTQEKELYLKTGFGSLKYLKINDETTNQEIEEYMISRGFKREIKISREAKFIIVSIRNSFNYISCKSQYLIRPNDNLLCTGKDLFVIEDEEINRIKKRWHIHELKHR